MNTTRPTPRFYRKRRTPWPIRIFLLVAILFGVWVDLSSDLGAADANAAATPSQPPLLGLAGEHSRVANVIRALAQHR